MNKLAQLEAILVLVFLFFLVFFIITFAIIGNHEPECIEDCRSFNSEFMDYEQSSSNKNEECWCKRNNTPLRIY